MGEGPGRWVYPCFCSCCARSSGQNCSTGCTVLWNVQRPWVKSERASKPEPGWKCAQWRQESRRVRVHPQPGQDHRSRDKNQCGDRRDHPGMVPRHPRNLGKEVGLRRRPAAHHRPLTVEGRLPTLEAPSGTRTKRSIEFWIMVGFSDLMRDGATAFLFMSLDCTTVSGPWCGIKVREKPYDPSRNGTTTPSAQVLIPNPGLDPSRHSPQISTSTDSPG